MPSTVVGASDPPRGRGTEINPEVEGAAARVGGAGNPPGPSSPATALLGPQSDRGTKQSSPIPMLNGATPTPMPPRPPPPPARSVEVVEVRL